MEYLMIAVFMCIALTTIVCGEINTVLSQTRIDIEVIPLAGGKSWRWPANTIKDVESLLMKSSNAINRALRVPFNGKIMVLLIENEHPKVLPRESTEHPFVMLLSPHSDYSNYWPQIVFQFAHEFCHILSGEVSKDNPNAWFHEAICELASGYILLKGEQQFNYESLEPNRVVSSETPTNYWIRRTCTARKDSEVRNYWENEKGNISVSLNQWVDDYEETHLRKQLNDDGWWRGEKKWRNHFTYVARVLLPIFIEDPSGWNAIRKLPASRGMLKEYLQDWHKQVDDSDKEFVEKVASEFGYTVE